VTYLKEEGRELRIFPPKGKSLSLEGAEIKERL